jgi:hypothetical protein
MSAMNFRVTHPLPALIKIEKRFPITHGHTSVISEDTIRASQLTHAYDNPPIRPLPILQEQSSDIIPDVQEVLMERFCVETQLFHRDITRPYLVPANWQIKETVDKYMSDMDQWRTHTHNHDKGTAEIYLQKWDFTIEKTGCLATCACSTDARVQRSWTVVGSVPTLQARSTVLFSGFIHCS